MAYNSSKIMSVDDSVLNGVLSIIQGSNKRMWSGTMTELGTNLIKVLTKKQSEMLPGSPGALRVVLNRVINRIRNRKVSVKFARTTDYMRTRIVKFTR